MAVEDAVTTVSSLARSVCAAMKPRVVYASSMSFSVGPTAPIWKKWSITAMESKPAWSPARTTAARSAPSADAPFGQVKSGICSPSFMLPDRIPGVAPGQKSRTKKTRPWSGSVTHTVRVRWSTATSPGFTPSDSSPLSVPAVPSTRVSPFCPPLV